MKIKAILIDDEPKALAILRNKLERMCPNVAIVGETQNPKEGVGLIEELRPQLLFLDIAMPEMSGFDLLAAIESPSFEIIFITAFDDYAIDAIKHCAIGYLVKPVDNEDLVLAVSNAAKNILDKTALEKNRLLVENLSKPNMQQKKVVVPTQDGLEFVKIKEIICCEGTDGYTRIHFTKRKSMLSSHSIGYFNKLLDNQSFYLTHKSYLINLNHADKYLNEGYVLLTNNHKIPVSRNRRNDFLEHLKN
ncbi:MAG: LytTR family DNA-binding domain-containing protein [Bacteroidota bacterium]